MNVNAKTITVRRTFKKRESLNTKEIDRLFKKGKKVRVKDYLGIYSFNGNFSPKLGVSIKKKFGKAVKRNYEKRIIKEVFRNSKSLLPNVDLFIIKITNDILSFKEKEVELKRLFWKIT